ncbi:hypothetical protein B0F90DRAFT_1757461 [Multifurca ochricompacta]|uniref:Bromodomain and PHD finger-containing protein n=1 Tax=Multifurca ochricompacta TaxID=376703 RepID=A0AAD4LXF1_9AGAM|nr:hypothetical protein B0F90DRAFT_1757461 [Multifurca ochricompacta]
MARGVASPAPISLPKVSFVKVVGEGSTARSGVHDNQQRSYGYNDFSLFERPQHYIRYIEPLEAELAVQVEYDMDEQDQDWLDALNAERKKEQLDKISYEAFEIVMDRLEKEWFDLTKNIPKPDLALPSEDSTCAICDDSEGENTNAIVFCDGCNLAVHQDCYGVPYIPEGQWLCRKCTVSPENPVSCFLCPNEGGAFKQTVHGEWVHLLCAIWIPETRVANEVFMEPITGVERISKQRWKLKCSVCDIREGACIQCSKNSCFLAYHVTCARKEKFLMPMKASSGLEPPPLQCFCEKHMPREKLEARAEALRAEAGSEHSEAKSSKSARAYAKTYKPGPPVVPALILSRILQYINKITIRKRAEFVELVCRYWSLKREARRGAPLLKRLHLEPWTASTGSRVQTDEEKVAKLELTRRLRKDLVDVRTLAELSRKRESRKLRQAQVVQEVLNQGVFAHEAGLRMTFENIVALDRQGFFKNPISKSQVPDYFDVIPQPMWWGAIDEKLDRHEYWDIDAFKADVNLVVENAMRYNKPGTPYYKAAQRIKSNSVTLLAELDSSKTSAPSELVGSHSDSPSSPVQFNPLLIGDLEPPLAMLDLLTSFDIANELNIVLRSNPLQFLLSYEFPEVIPPPPPPVLTRPVPPHRKSKRERKAELAKRRAERRVATAAAAALAAQVDSELFDTSSAPHQPPTTSKPMNSVAEGAFADLAPTTATTATAPPIAVSIQEDLSETEQQVLGKRKRFRPAPSQPGTDAEVLTDINPMASFALFDKGWILEPGVRRGGRARVELPRPMLPKKRSKVSDSKAGALETLVPEDGGVGEDVSRDISSHSGGTASALSGASDDYHRTADAVSLNTDNSNPYHETAAWPPETDEIEVLTAESSKHLAGPGVIPTQAAMPTPVPQVAERGQGAQTPELDEGMILDDQEPVMPSLPLSELERGDATYEEATIHEEYLKTSQHMESSISMSPPRGDPPAALLTLEEARLKVKLEPNMTLSQDPDGKLVIQELDSPVTRREKAMRRKQARSKLAAPALAAYSVLDGSDLSSLSELSEEEVGNVHDKIKSDGKKVWAKAKNFPWWAAVIFEPDDPAVPPKVLNSRPTKSKSPMGHHLVRFYDSSKSWQWVEVDQLLLLGENDELDQSLLTTSRRQKFSSAKMRQGCRESYRCFVLIPPLNCHLRICVLMRFSLEISETIRQAKMEMETEDDAVVEGNADTSSVAAATVADQELQLVADMDAEMVLAAAGGNAEPPPVPLVSAV